MWFSDIHYHPYARRKQILLNDNSSSSFSDFVAKNECFVVRSLFKHLNLGNIGGLHKLFRLLMDQRRKRNCLRRVPYLRFSAFANLHNAVREKLWSKQFGGISNESNFWKRMIRKKFPPTEMPVHRYPDTWNQLWKNAAPNKQTELQPSAWLQ